MAKIPKGWKNSFKPGRYATHKEAKNIAASVRKYEGSPARVHEISPGKFIVLEK